MNTCVPVPLKLLCETCSLTKSGSLALSNEGNHTPRTNGKDSHEQSVENELEVSWKGREVAGVVWSPLWSISREIMTTWPRVMCCAN